MQVQAQVLAELVLAQAWDQVQEAADLALARG